MSQLRGVRWGRNGYVQEVPLTSSTIIDYLVFYGVNAAKSPSSAAILASSSLNTQDRLITLDFPNATEQYIFFAMPTAITGFTTVLIEGIPVSLDQEAINLTVNSVVTPYILFTSQYLQNGDGITLEIVE